MRPHFLPRTKTRKAHSRATILSDLIGDLLVRFGWVKPTLALDELDPVLADLKRREQIARASHGRVVDIQEARRKRLHQLLAGEVRHV